MTLSEALTEAKEKLYHACERPYFEAELLLSHHLNKPRIYLITHSDEALNDTQAFYSLVNRRAAHEPMEYITHKVSFYDTELYIASGALIPRPETELLVDEASSIIEQEHLSHIAEIGIGSGAISIMLARKFPNLKIEASDISEDALLIAHHNIKTFDLQDRVNLHHTSLFDDIKISSKCPIEMLVSNPPYIPINTPLAPNVAEYEPHTALYSEERGDELLRKIILDTSKREIKYLICEMGYDQKKYISDFVKELGVYSILFYQDFSGLDRGFIIKFTE